jgi:tRNA modification GTPase
MYQLEDTICAIATPAGEGGIGIVRVSGDKAFDISGRLFPPLMTHDKKRQILIGRFQDPATNEILDEGLVLVMPSPNSYTAEDVVEFHAHGSPSLLARMMDLLVGQGARQAEPGEFTYRAFIHGRLDMTQAEAVEALVSAKGEAARRQALRQLTGGLASHLEPMEELLKSLYLKVEARLEFSEDGIAPLDRSKFNLEVKSVLQGLTKLSESYEQGKVLRDGLTIALVGPPNVGKSSLLNRILGMDRAIVTPLAGTTRDVVEGEIKLKGVKVRFFDTAGIRESSNVVEEEGIRRSQRVIQEADVVLWVVDAIAYKEGIEQFQALSLPSDRTWIMINKVDLIEDRGGIRVQKMDRPTDRQLFVSCLTGEGFPQLMNLVEGMIQTSLVGDDIVLTSGRHRKEVDKACSSLMELQTLINNDRPMELWAEEIKSAALAIGRIRGRNLPVAAFEEIFNRFCIGK